MSSSVVFNHILWDCNSFSKLNNQKGPFMHVTAKGREPINITWMWTVKDNKVFFYTKRS